MQPRERFLVPQQTPQGRTALSDRPVAIGSYVFAGGFTLGVRAAGFDVQCVLEDGDYGVAVALDNQPDVPIFVGRENWPMDSLLHEQTFDLIYGNPPCAAWSAAGAAMTEATKACKDWRTDPRVDCTRIHFGLLEDLAPQAWVWESVTNAFTKGREFVDELTAYAVELGYDVSYVLHDARWLGLPQVRKRFFFVASKFKFDIDLATLSWEEIPCGPALDAMQHRGEPYPGGHIENYADWLHLATPGKDLRQSWEILNPPEVREYHPNGYVKGRPPFTIKRPHPDRPANTIMNEMVHPVEHRALSIREMAMLCGYPPEYRFPETANGAHSLVARGVCPTIGEWIAGQILRCLRRGEATAEPEVKTIDVRRPPEPKRDKTRRTRAPARTREPAVPKTIAEPPEDAFAPDDGEGSGSYIKRLLVKELWSTPEIVALVHAHYEGRTTTGSDVSYNANALRNEGVEFERVIRRDLIAPRPWEDETCDDETD